MLFHTKLMHDACCGCVVETDTFVSHVWEQVLGALLPISAAPVMQAHRAIYRARAQRTRARLHRTAQARCGTTTSTTTLHTTGVRARPPPLFALATHTRSLSLSLSLPHLFYTFSRSRPNTYVHTFAPPAPHFTFGTFSVGAVADCM